MDGKRILDIFVTGHMLADEQIVTLIEDVMRGVPRSYGVAFQFMEAAKRDNENYDCENQSAYRKTDDKSLPLSIHKTPHYGIVIEWDAGPGSDITYEIKGDVIFQCHNKAVSGRIHDDSVTFCYKVDPRGPGRDVYISLKNGKIIRW